MCVVCLMWFGWHKDGVCVSSMRALSRGSRSPAAPQPAAVRPRAAVRGEPCLATLAHGVNKTVFWCEYSLNLACLFALEYAPLYTITKSLAAG